MHFFQDQSVHSVVSHVRVGLAWTHIDRAMPMLGELARLGRYRMAAWRKVRLKRPVPAEQAAEFAVDPDRNGKVSSHGGRALDYEMSGIRRASRKGWLHEGKEQDEKETCTSDLFHGAARVIRGDPTTE